MKKHYKNEETGISYTLQGDYYLPDLTLPEDTETRSIGIYGERHGHYLKNHRKIFYTQLLTSGKLQSYLADIDEQSRKHFEILVKQLAEKEGVTEQLKEENQMEWVGKMNNTRHRADEIINHEIIYA